jgi:hypothetical protein
MTAAAQNDRSSFSNIDVIIFTPGAPRQRRIGQSNVLLRTSYSGARKADGNALLDAVRSSCAARFVASFNDCQRNLCGLRFGATLRLALSMALRLRLPFQGTHQRSCIFSHYLRPAPVLEGETSVQVLRAY